MSNILGIVAEYNPLHNGHVFQIQKAKEIANADYVIAVMGGNFQQRGNTSIVDKWEKTKMALSNGVDMVIELPTIYNISSAENFAYGSLKIMKELGIITHISFGMESFELSLLDNIANILYKEPRDYQILLKKELSTGLSFPIARQNALVKYFDSFNSKNNILNISNFSNESSSYQNSCQSDNILQILSGSNNILAIEYLKAIKKLKYNVVPIGITRNNVYHNSNKAVNNYASSTAIRSMLFNNKLDEISNVMPHSSFNILLENIKNGTYNLDLKNFSRLIIYKIRSMSISDLKLVPDICEGLENSIKKASNETNDIYELINKIKSKRYTQTRLQRIMLYILLNITKYDIDNSKKITPYIRVLGVGNSSKNLLSLISSKNVITSVKDFEKKNMNSRIRRILDIDKFSTDIYTIGYKSNSIANLDYTKKLIVL